ncbi:MAG: hypothetical protein HPY66_1829 [Firmicutes bacterium]|nr:hypothetical protein [Bacillota bacterium]
MLDCGITGIIYNPTKLEVIPAKIAVKTPEISTFQEFCNNLVHLTLLEVGFIISS